jgi:hypothetical protein
MAEDVNFREGQRLGASALNSAINTRIADVRVGPGLLLQRLGGVATISLASRPTAAGSSSVPVGTCFVVALDQVGGSNGTATTAPTYTYDASSLDSNITNTALSPRFARPNGAVTAASWGIGFIDPDEDNTLQLLYAHEIPTTDTCT